MTALARAALACCLLVATPLTASAAPLAADGPGTAAVRTANDTLRTLLGRHAAPGSPEEAALAREVTTRLRGFLDIDELGQRALVDHWKETPAEERRALLDTLRELIERSYVEGLRANLRYDVRYAGETGDGDGLQVTTHVLAEDGGRPVDLEIVYALHRVGATWHAYDVVQDGVSLVANYRAMFDRIIRKEGVDGLLARMRKKVAATASAADAR